MNSPFKSLSIEERSMIRARILPMIRVYDRTYQGSEAHDNTPIYILPGTTLGMLRAAKRVAEWLEEGA